MITVKWCSVDECYQLFEQGENGKSEHVADVFGPESLATTMAASLGLLVACEDALACLAYPDPSMEGSIQPTLRAAIAKAREPVPATTGATDE